MTLIKTMGSLLMLAIMAALAALPFAAVASTNYNTTIIRHADPQTAAKAPANTVSEIILATYNTDRAVSVVPLAVNYRPTPQIHQQLASATTRNQPARTIYGNRWRGFRS